mmetsp:Transcript_4545/g.12377  ORF Transcript_4545/g.12377 Transcript_4545/m.12377 type:complete len:433 (+) Transcript_4545:38-1336(+)
MDTSVSVSQNLVLLADGLKVDSDVEKRGNLLLDKLLKTIREKSRFKIYRVVKAGSLGKKTAIRMKVDYDCVFLFDSLIDKKAFMDDMDDILLLNFNIRKDGRTQNTISLHCDSFAFDFLPGVYAAQDPEEQVRQTVQARDGKLHVGLVEGTVIFMKEQSSLVHQLARLLKYWSHTVLIPGFFHGRSYTLELFAVMAGEELGKGGINDLLHGFRVGLRLIRDFQGVYQVWTRFYGKADVDAAVLSERPLLLDVSNPANNLLGPDRVPFLRKMSGYASVTLDKLDALSRGVPEYFVNLFETQPEVWNTMRNVPKRASFLIGAARKGDVGQVQPRVEARRNAQYLQKEMEVYAHALSAMLHREFFCWKDLASNDAQTVLQDCVDKLLNTGSNRASPTEKFEDKEVLVIIPLELTGGHIKVGFDLEVNREYADPKA